MARIVGIGNPLWDVFAPAATNMEVVERFGRGSSNHLAAGEIEEILPRISDARWVAGGGARNTLALLAALGHETYLTGAVGDDERGTGYRRELAAAGIADSLTSAGRAATGTCVTLIHETGETTVVVSPGAALELAHVSSASGTAPRHPDVVILEGFVAPRSRLAASAVEYAANAGAALLVDLGHPGVSPAAAAVVEAAAEQMPDGGARALVFGTEAEVSAAGDSAGAGELAPARARFEAGIARLSASAGVVVVKRAERGAAVYRGGVENASASPSAWNGPVIDTTGAGDVFAGAFLAAWLRDIPDTRACELANLAAGMSLSSYGGRLTGEQLRVLMGEVTGES